MKMRTYGALLGLSTLALACGDDGGGGSSKLRVLLAAEETISNGLEVGSEEENTRDFAVKYTKYLVAIGDVRVGRTEPKLDLVSNTAFIVDMRQVGEQGLELVTFDDVQPGQWDQFGYDTPVASATFQKLGGVSDADAQEMITKGLTYWIEGTVERPGKPVSFEFKVAVPSTYTDCESNGQPGISVSEGGTSTATITLHGDHPWFDSLVRGDEGTVARRAQWLVTADTDGDGKVVTEDLAKVPAEVAFPSAQGYNLSGGPDGSGGPIPINNALDYVRGQLATQGHLNGEGECETALR